MAFSQHVLVARRLEPEVKITARFLQAGSFWLPRQEFAGLFLEIWTLLANFTVTSEGPRQVGYKKYFMIILPGL